MEYEFYQYNGVSFDSGFTRYKGLFEQDAEKLDDDAKFLISQIIEYIEAAYSKIF